MLVVLSDTHSESGHELTDHLLDRVRSADRVVHAGDFTTEAALDAFRDVCPRLEAVHGNADSAAVRDRLPTALSFTYDGVHVAVTHRRQAGAVGLRMFGRERGADLVISGHTHRQTVVEGTPVLLNPGSHAQPRGNRPGYAVLESVDDGLSGEVRTPDGALVGRFHVVERGR